MKRIVAVFLKRIFLFACISGVMILCITSDNVYSAQTPLNIKIGLKYAKTALTSVDLSFDSGVQIENYDGLQYKTLLTLYDQEKLTAKLNIFNSKIDIYDTSNKLLLSTDLTKGYYIKFIPLGEGDLKQFKYGNNIYRGNALLYGYSNIAFNLINELDLEQYVYGVVPREISPSWNIEALKAQAVAARTYAVKNINKHKKYGFDLCADTDCQVYGGFKAEDPRSNISVDETKGKLIYYNNKVIDAVFFATSGGSTEDAVNVWGTDIPYLKGVDDSMEPQKIPLKTWTKNFDLKKLQSILKARKIDIGDIVDLKIDDISNNGRVLSLTFVGTKGEKSYKKDNIRAILGLNSTYFTIQKTDNEDAPLQATDKEYVISKDSKVCEINKNISIISQQNSGTAQIKTAESLNGKIIISDKDTKTVETKNGDTTKTNNSTEYIIDGKGNGHGVGMSQNGAKGMADNGKDYITILKHYYTGVEVK